MLRRSVMRHKMTHNITYLIWHTLLATPCICVRVDSGLTSLWRRSRFLCSVKDRNSLHHLCSLTLLNNEKSALRYNTRISTVGKAVSLRDVKACRDVEVQLHLFVTSILDESEWWTSGAGQRTLGTQWTGGWVGPKTGLDAFREEDKSLVPARNRNMIFWKSSK